MFNDDPYKLQRVKPQQGTVGGVPAAPAKPTVPPGLVVPPPLNPVTPPPNDFVAPKLRRDAAMFAPFTNAFSPDAAAGKLVEHRLTRSGQAMPSTIGPPAPAGLAQPPQQGFFQRYAPKSTANIDYGSTPRPGESRLGVVGRGIAGAAGLATAIPEAFLTSAIDGTANSLKVTGGAVKDLYGSMTGAPVPPQQRVPTAAPTITTPPTTNQRPIVSIGPKRIAAGVNALGGALTRATSLAAAPQQTMTDQQIWDTRAKGRMVNGVQTFDSEWAKDPNNARRLELYAGNGNAVMSVVPAPGVAASTVTGGNMPEGVLTRAPRGFTAEDRARQVEAMTDRGNAYRAGEAADYARTRGRMAIASGDLQRAEAIGKQAMVESGMQVAPPTASSQAMGTQRLAGQKQAVDQGNAAAKLAMEQQSAALQDEQMQLVNQGMGRAQAQAQQEQGLMDQFLNGTPDQQATAGKKLAVLRNTPAGEFTKVKVPIQTGVDLQGNPVFGNGEILVNKDGSVAFDPRTQAKRPLPNGKTAEDVLADARAAVASGAPRDAMNQELSQFGLQL